LQWACKESAAYQGVDDPASRIFCLGNCSFLPVFPVGGGLAVIDFVLHHGEAGITPAHGPLAGGDEGYRRPTLVGHPEPEHNRSHCWRGRDEIAAMPDLGRKAGVIDPQDARLLESVINFRRVKVKDVLTPRTVVKSLRTGIQVREAIKIATSENYSR
jgi:hypothetical protein